MHIKYIVKLFRKNPRVNNKKSFYIVVATNLARVNGGYLDKIGFVSCDVEGNKLCGLNLKKLGYWMNKGAIVKPRVLYYLGYLRSK